MTRLVWDCAVCDHRPCRCEFDALREDALSDGRLYVLLEVNGLKLEMFQEISKPEDDGCLVYRALLVLPNGESREQQVAGDRFARNWRETAIRRMERSDPDSLTPQTIISMK